LDSSWIGISETNSDGILIFSEISDITESPELLQNELLDSNLIQNFLDNSSIVSSLSTENKEYYLQLVSDSTFYITTQPPQQFFTLGPFFNVQLEPILLPSKITTYITIDEIQQNFLRHGITKKDIDTLALFDIECGQMHFTLAKIFKVFESTVKVIIYVQKNIGLDEEWIQMDNMKKIFSKEKCIAKNIELTKNGVLKIKWRSFIENKYQI
jgi:hypothetical protein